MSELGQAARQQRKLILDLDIDRVHQLNCRFFSRIKSTTKNMQAAQLISSNAKPVKHGVFQCVLGMIERKM
jgi:hypothetical protein